MKTKDGLVHMASQPRGDTKEGTVLIPYANLTKSDVVYLYLFVYTPDKMRSSGSVYVPIE
jgi:hypothetical protein